MLRSKPTRFVGIDYGMARIGIAISDESKTIARSLTTMASEKKMGATVQKLVQLLHKHEEEYNYSIEEIVVGLPLLMSGKKGLLADEVGHFIEELKKSIPIPIFLWDERLTSVQADRSLREGKMNRKKRAAHVDVVAAMIILQNYLDHKKGKIL